jgi:carboxypeptidase Q
MIAWEAAQLLKDMGVTPKRTIRVVLFTAEENGVWGGKAYASERFEDLRLVAAIESDSGNGRADNLRLDLAGFSDKSVVAKAQERVAALLKAVEPFGITEISPGYSGADVGHSVRKGVPGFGLGHDTVTYWPIHHTHADTFDKIVAEDLAHNVGVMAATVYWLAEADLPLVDLADLPTAR